MKFDDAHDIVRLMRRLSMAQRGRKIELLRDLGLQPGQDVVLMELSFAGSTSQNELAAAAEVDEPSVGRSIARLERKGLVKRSPDREDSRRRLVRLTPQGEELIPKLREIYMTVATQAVGDSEDIDALKQTLQLLVDRFELTERRRRAA